MLLSCGTNCWVIASNLAVEARYEQYIAAVVFRGYIERERERERERGYTTAAIYFAATIFEGGIPLVNRGSRTAKRSTAKYVLLYGPRNLYFSIHLLIKALNYPLINSNLKNLLQQLEQSKNELKVTLLISWRYLIFL